MAETWITSSQLLRKIDYFVIDCVSKMQKLPKKPNEDRVCFFQRKFRAARNWLAAQMVGVHAWCSRKFGDFMDIWPGRTKMKV